jgi:hypothetical protein
LKFKLKTEYCSDKGLEERKEVMKTKIVEEKILGEFLKQVSKGVDVQSTEEDLIESLKK